MQSSLYPIKKQQVSDRMTVVQGFPVEKVIKFDQRIPTVDDAFVLHRLEFNSCGNLTLNVQLVKLLSSKVVHGAPLDAIWRISSNSLQRYVRMSNGKKSLTAFVNKFGHMDEEYCVHRTSGKAYCVRRTEFVEHADVGLDSHERNIRGVPQRTANSGVCWFAAMCFVAFFNSRIADVLRVKGRDDPEFQRLSLTALHNATDAELLRQHLYNRYSLGDKPGIREEMEGQNGFGQFCILVAKFKIPLIRYLMPDVEITTPIVDQEGKRVRVNTAPRANEPVVLGLRCYHSKCQPPRRFIMKRGAAKGRVFRIVAAFIGSEHCGHQIGMSCRGEDLNSWAVADSDASMHGIGPVFWRVLRASDESRAAFRQRWWESFNTNVPVTVTQKSFCDLSPQNRTTGYIETLQTELSATNSPSRGKDTEPGVVNVDYIYVSSPRAT